IASISTISHAQGLRYANGSADQFDTLASGDQLVLEDRSEMIQFAGHEINLSGFSGIIGYASDIAYELVISGSASIGDKSAEPGSLTKVRPYGGDSSIERFDAVRLRDFWDENNKISMPQVYASLDKLDNGQAKAIFLGRFGRTNFNVAASGRASQELAKRTVV